MRRPGVAKSVVVALRGGDVGMINALCVRGKGRVITHSPVMVS